MLLDIIAPLRSGLDRAQAGLNDAERSVAGANAGQASRAADAAMAKAAKAALFEDALESEVHARFAELKTVTK